MALRNLAEQVEGGEGPVLLRREAINGQDREERDQVPDRALLYLDEEHGQEEVPQEEWQQLRAAVQDDFYDVGVLFDFEIRCSADGDTVRGQDLRTSIEVRWK